MGKILVQLKESSFREQLFLKDGTIIDKKKPTEISDDNQEEVEKLYLLTDLLKMIVPKEKVVEETSDKPLTTAEKKKLAKKVKEEKAKKVKESESDEETEETEEAKTE